MHAFKTLLLTLLGVALLGCANQRAVQGALIAKEVVDAGARLTRQHLEAKEKECEAFVGEGEQALRACLGPIAGRPDEIDAAFESARAAQLALYLAVTTEDREATKQAQKDLAEALTRVLGLIQAIREAK